ncbi:MAG: TetR/AcrR family transcriptional regulator [Dehalococcoidia bacterium]
MTTNQHESASGDRARPVDAPHRPRPAGRPRGASDSSRQIARTVADLISERGLHGWSMRDLAARLGLSTGTITHHFRDKRTLLIEAMDSSYALPADWDRYRTLPPGTQLRRMVETFLVDSDRRRRGWRFYLEYLTGAGHDPLLRERHDERYARQRRFFTRLIAAGIESGQFVTDLGAEREAESLLALGTGLAVQQLVTPENLPPAAAREILEAYVRRLEGQVDRPVAGG